MDNFLQQGFGNKVDPWPRGKAPGCQSRGPWFDPWLGRWIVSEMLFIVFPLTRDELGWKPRCTLACIGAIHRACKRTKESLR